MIALTRLKELRLLISRGEGYRFYSWREWINLRQEVLRLDNYECQLCKAKGRYSPARIVHHVQHLHTAPELALSIWAAGPGTERQLISVCKSCHEKLHPEAQRQNRPPDKEPLTPERWD